MFESSRVTSNVRILSLIAGCCLLFARLPIAQTATEISSGVAERGEDFSVYERVTAETGPTGAVTLKTNRLMLLENCLNYLEDGQWKESEDVIETAPVGAIARRGPNKAIFSPDLNSPAVFDILTSDSHRLRGGVRAIQLTDVASGKSVTVAKVKMSAQGKLLPPDRILYGDAFAGLKADVILV